METVKLSNGVIMPMEGFGVFQIPEEACEQAVKDAKFVGGRTEKSVGEGQYHCHFNFK